LTGAAGAWTAFAAVNRVEKMKKYLIVVEKTNTGYSAFSPDLDGWVATGATRKSARF